jgi:hypothetical protein
MDPITKIRVSIAIPTRRHTVPLRQLNTAEVCKFSIGPDQIGKAMEEVTRYQAIISKA